MLQVSRDQIPAAAAAATFSDGGENGPRPVRFDLGEPHTTPRVVEISGALDCAGVGREKIQLTIRAVRETLSAVAAIPNGPTVHAVGCVGVVSSCTLVALEYLIPAYVDYRYGRDFVDRSEATSTASDLPASVGLLETLDRLRVTTSRLRPCGGRVFDLQTPECPLVNFEKLYASNGRKFVPGTEHVRLLDKFGCRVTSTEVKVNANGAALKKKQLWSLEPCCDAGEEAVRLRSHLNRYLAVDQFGNVTCDAEEPGYTAEFIVNANGAALKKKQLWSLEPCCDAGEEAVRLRSHLNRYLAVDQFGNVTCDAEEPGPGAIFQITVSADAKGQWALRNTNRGYFLGASADQLVCVAKAPGPSELWTVHLAARPQVTIRSIGRRRYAHLSGTGDEIQVDAATPWGEDTLFTLEFRDGKYALHTANDRYLCPDGKLIENCAPECLFSLEFHSGYLALRDVNLRYLSPIGSKAVMRTRSNSVTRDELFSLEDSVPQAAFVGFNGKYVSVKQGVDVTANQDEVSDHETFQLEWDKETGRWFVRTMQDKYWSLESSSGIQANADKGCVCYSSWPLLQSVPPDGSVTLVASNGKLVGAKKSGHLFANCEPGDPAAKFHFALVNRPVLVLRCDQGFVGRKGPSSPRLECNRASYEIVHVERADRGVCHLKGNNGKYWGIAEDGSISVDSDDTCGFYVELREPSRLCLKTADGSYLNADKNGAFKAGAADPSQATLWEY
ncbi:hypothetical protein HPB51_009966 [Rhipicephalus microplus]|uniref:Fascin-like domain-containing protein n=1 Tax=Rhipicephalus microplus TaxID=6941 RepID=A0A9J6ESC4_RHIMP|nr:hypothetical protein HPB51_009966 [Rhipicephalus microplus]